MSRNLIKFSIGRSALKGAMIKSLKSLNKKNITILKKTLNRKHVSFDQISKIYSRSMISLGVSELWNTYLIKKPVHKIHLRAFEIAMSGGLQLTTRTEELKNYFDENKEILLYSSYDEFRDKLLFYSNKKNRKIREKIKINARLRCQNEHTWFLRFKKIFELLNITKIA